MKIGIVKEIKESEYRVGAVPTAVTEFVRRGHEVFVETKAGVGSGFSDEDYKAAADYFEQAAKNGVDANYNLGIISMKAGDYKKASELMKSVKCDYNVALNYVATKNYAAAKSALDCIEHKTAEDYYLLAVVGARTKDAALAANNLKEAFRLDSSLKARALKDAEFYKIKDEAAIRAILQ